MAEDWHYSIYPNDAPSEAFGEYAGFIDLWRAKSAGGRLPAWSDFQLKDFEGWYGRLVLCEYLNDPFNQRVVLWGTTVVEWTGVEWTGKTLREVYSDVFPTLWKLEELYHQALIDRSAIGFTYGNLRFTGKDFAFADAVDLPLSRDGKAVTHVLSAVSRRRTENEFVPQVAPECEF